MPGAVTIGYSSQPHAAASRSTFMQTLPWIIALAAVGLLASALTILALRLRRQPGALPPLPAEWNLSPRPVFGTDERRVYRLLREALPHHVILAKLPLVRLCQPSDPGEVRYWYELLGPIHVTFAVCSPNGRVLAAIDLDSDRGTPRRTQQIKQSVLAACRVRYLRCPVDNLPTAAELQLLVPQSGLAARGPAAIHALQQARSTLTSTVANRRSQRAALWQESSQFADSFFAPDNRSEAFGHSDFAALDPLAARAPSAGPPGGADIGGVVVDQPAERAAANGRR